MDVTATDDQLMLRDMTRRFLEGIIEKTEIIEMAIDHIRHLISTVDKNSKNTDVNKQ